MEKIEKAKVWDYMLQEAIIKHSQAPPGNDLGKNGGIIVHINSSYQNWEHKGDFSFEEFKLAVREMHDFSPSIGRIIESDFTFFYEPSDHILKLKEIEYSFVEEISNIELEQELELKNEIERKSINNENAKIQLRLNKWLIKTKWVPHIFATISIIVSICALVFSLSK
jgi:hypothetical protein